MFQTIGFRFSGTVVSPHKNIHYLFCNNNHGGTVVAGYYTINHTAQLNNLDPEKYLMYIFSRITDPKYRNMPELLEEILPWNRHFAVQIFYLTPGITS